MAQFKADLPAVRWKWRFKANALRWRAERAAAAVEEESESELRGSTCTGVTTLRPSAPRHAHEKTTQSSPSDELCFTCLADTINPIDGWRCDACKMLRLADRIDGGTRCSDRFRAAREQVACHPCP